MKKNKAKAKSGKKPLPQLDLTREVITYAPRVSLASCLERVRSILPSPGQVTLLGLDPGFANFGWALARWDGRTLLPIAMGVLHTEKSDAKRGTLAASDNYRRGLELAGALQQLIALSDAVCAESASFGFAAFGAKRKGGFGGGSVSSGIKQGYAWGVLSGVLQCVPRPLCEASTITIKLDATGGKGASKEEVQKGLDKLFGNVPRQLVVNDGLRKDDFEHAYDGLGAAWSCTRSEIVKALVSARRT